MKVYHQQVAIDSLPSTIHNTQLETAKSFDTRNIDDFDSDIQTSTQILIKKKEVDSLKFINYSRILVVRSHH